MAYRCRATRACREDGHCTTLGGLCIATGFDCLSSEACDVHGRCTAHHGECIATRLADCQRSRECTEGGDCDFDPDDQECDDGVRNSTAAMATGIAMLGLGGAAGLFTLVIAAFTGFEGDDFTTGFGIGSGALVGIGTGLTIYGSIKGPRNQDDFALRIGPGSANLSWRF